MRQLAFILGAFAFAPILAMAQTTVSGTVESHEGMPLELAHVHLFTMPDGIGSEAIGSVEVGADGRFVLEIGEPGNYHLAVTGVDHEAFTTPLLVGEDDEEITVEIRIGRIAYNPNPEELRIIGDWNDFDFRTAVPMERNDRGAFVYTFETDQTEVQYQIIGLGIGYAGERSINQPGSDAYVYDGGGDYRSVRKVKPGRVTIVVDPAMLPTGGAAGGIAIFRDEMWRSQITEMAMMYDETTRGLAEEMRRLREMAEETGEEVAFDPAPAWQGVAEMASVFITLEEHDPRVRQYSALILAQVLGQVRDPEAIGINDERVAMIREVLPFTSPMWEIAPMSAWNVAAYGVGQKDIEGQEAAALALYRESSVPILKAIGLTNAAMIAKYQGDHEKLKERYEELVENYDDLGNEMIAYYITMLDPNSAVQTGNRVPAFRVVLEDGKGTVVTDESMKGKYYLIDFWATWCGPCIAEMPELHAAYERFAGDDFEVLSLSFDSDFAKVEQFREARYAMPWLHTFVEGGFRSDIARDFEVSGIPKPVLVDPNGIIVATESELRGSRLEATLAKFLGDEQAMQ